LFFADILIVSLSLLGVALTHSGLQIERLFENASRLNSFFDGLLFSESLEKALEQIRVQP